METTKEFKERIKNNHKLVNIMRRLRPDLRYVDILYYIFNLSEEALQRWYRIVKMNPEKCKEFVNGIC